MGPGPDPRDREDVPKDSNGRESLRRLLVAFAGLAVTIGTAGWALEKGATVIANDTRLGEAVVGTLFTAVATSLPELVTTLAAVRRGALTLAVAGIIGGNAFDSLFAAFSDVAYLEGSIYHAVSDPVVFWTALGMLMTAFLLMGLIRRQEQGPGRIGFESLSLFGFYTLGVVVVVAAG